MQPMKSKKSKQKITYKKFIEEVEYIMFTVFIETIICILWITLGGLTTFISTEQIFCYYCILMTVIFLSKIGYDLYYGIQ